MIRKSSQIQSETGFSLIELLVAIAFFSVFLLFSLDSLWKASDALKRQEHTMTRLRTIHSIINILGMPSALRVSGENAGSNSPLKKCILGGPCHANKIQDLSVYLPLVVPDNGSIKTSGLITGPPSSPILYNFEGMACDPKISQCPAADFPIAVSTQFQGFCPPAYDISVAPPWKSGDPVFPDGLKMDTNVCWRGQYIKVFFKFAPTPGTPPYLFFEPVTGFIMVNVGPAAFPY